MATAKKTKAVKKPAETTKADRVRASESRKLDAGGRRIPGGVMPADVVKALETLQKEQYAPTASGCIFRALVDAAKRIKPAKSY